MCVNYLNADPVTVPLTLALKGLICPIITNPQIRKCRIEKFCAYCLRTPLTMVAPNTSLKEILLALILIPTSNHCL